MNNMHKPRNECSTCGEPFEGLIGDHFRSQHSEEEFKQAVLKAKERGISDQEIGALFGITFRQQHRPDLCTSSLRKYCSVYGFQRRCFVFIHCNSHKTFEKE